MKQELDFYTDMEKPEEAITFYFVADAGRVEGNTINMTPKQLVENYNDLLAACEAAQAHVEKEIEGALKGLASAGYDDTELDEENVLMVLLGKLGLAIDFAYGEVLREEEEE